MKHFGDYGLAVELRHKSWSDDPGTAALLRGGGAAWVEIDEPKFSSSVASDVPLTADKAYFRFHGRNAEMWWQGNGELRYKYLYSPEEISQLAEKVRAAGEKAAVAFAFFNNHWQAYAPRNANDLKKALQLPFTGFASSRLLEQYVAFFASYFVQHILKQPRRRETGKRQLQGLFKVVGIFRRVGCQWLLKKANATAVFSPAALTFSASWEISSGE